MFVYCIDALVRPLESENILRTDKKNPFRYKNRIMDRGVENCTRGLKTFQNMTPGTSPWKTKDKNEMGKENNSVER